MWLALMIGGLVVSGLLMAFEVRAGKKSRQFNRLSRFVLTRLHTNEAVKESVILSGGAAAGTIFDVYATLEDQAAFRQVIEHRFPDAMGDAQPIDWMRQVEQLYANGDQAVNGYVNAYAGQRAEDLAADRLRAEGYEVQAFESRTHPDDDLSAAGEDVGAFDVSVKSYGDLGAFKRALSDHPDSDHYVVNSELYQQLQSQGLLQHYADQGISIRNGGYSNEALRAEGHDSLEAMHEATDLADNIPYVGFMLMGFKSADNIRQFRKGRQSKHELGKNLTSDAARIGVASGGAFAGAKTGAAIGTVFSPGIGTVVGGAVGALIGGIAGSTLVNWFKEKWKWGDILQTQLTVGRAYMNGLSSHMRQSWRQNVFQYRKLLDKQREASAVRGRYSDQLSVFSSRKVTIPAVLSYLYEKNICAFIHRVDQAVPAAEKQLYDLCAQAAAASKPDADRKEAADLQARYWGEILLNSRMLDSRQELSLRFADEISRYEAQKAKHPNYPTRFTVEADELVTGKSVHVLQNFRPKEKWLSGVDRMRIAALLFNVAALALAFYAGVKWFLH